MNLKWYQTCAPWILPFTLVALAMKKFAGGQGAKRKIYRHYAQRDLFWWNIAASGKVQCAMHKSREGESLQVLFLKLRYSKIFQNCEDTRLHLCMIIESKQNLHDHIPTVVWFSCQNVTISTTICLFTFIIDMMTNTKQFTSCGFVTKLIKSHGLNFAALMP